MRQEKTIVTQSEILNAMSGGKESFSEYYSDTDQIIIRGITVKERLVIDGSEWRTQITFVDCDLLGGVDIDGGTFNGLSICGGHMTRPMIVNGGVFSRSFQLKEIDALHMGDEIYWSVAFLGGEFNCNIDIYKGAFQDIVIGGAVLKGVSIRTGPVSSWNHKLQPYAKKLTVAPKQIDVLEVDAFDIGRLSFSGVLDKGLCFFGDLQLNQLEFRSFLNLGRVRFDRVTVSDHLAGKNSETSLSMTRSHLGQTRFSQMDLTKFAKIEISDCTLADIESSNTKWFSSGQIASLGDEGKRDLFRQLKHAMTRQGNRIDELYFQSLEMDAYRRTLSFKTGFWDLIILSIGKYTNNYGTNYILPTVWIIVMAFLVLLCSIWAEGLSLRDEWGGIFIVMNPAHSIDYLAPKDKLSNTFMAVDFAGRVLISILIYQLITSFRKFARG